MKNKIVTTKLGFTLLLVIFLIGVTCYKTFAQTCQPVPVGLVSWWSGDGNSLDSRSGNNSNQTLGTPLFIPAKVGQGMKFGGADDGFAVPDSPNLDVGVGDSFTVSLWVRADSLSGSASQFQSVFAKEDIAGGGGGLYRLLLRQDGVFDFEITDSSSNGRQALAPGITTGIFNHVSVVFDRSAGEMRIYVNGVLQETVITTGIGSLANAGRFFIGHRSLDSGTGALSFNGAVDELSYYNRTLSASEIQAIFNAGTAGKCKPTATVAPSGLVGWWSGDGNANDISINGNNGAFSETSSFAVGKVGQNFNFTGAQTVQVPDNSTLDFTNAFSIESWVFPTAAGNSAGQTFFISKGNMNFANTQSYGIIFLNDRRIVNRVANGSTLDQLVSTIALPLNTFTHIATTYDGGTLRVYINGVLDNSAATSIGTLLNSSQPLIIGGADLNGSTITVASAIDEVSLYNRALTQSEITSIFNAGIAGKLKTVTTPTGFAELSEPSAVVDGLTENFKSPPMSSNNKFQTSATADGSDLSPQAVNVTVGDTTITFPAVINAGTTQQIPLDLSQLPNLPIGSTTTGLTYDIATNAIFTGSPQICFKLPSITNSTDFNNLRILHLENNVWTNRTDLASINFPTNTICTSGLTSLSPFAVVNGFAPTAASVSVGGRIFNSKGRAVYRARISITDANGEVRTAITNPFGYYRFNDVQVGESYIFDVRAKGYSFVPQILNISEDLKDLNFTLNN